MGKMARPLSEWGSRRKGGKKRNKGEQLLIEQIKKRIKVSGDFKLNYK